MGSLYVPELCGYLITAMTGRFGETISRVETSRIPLVEFIKRGQSSGSRVGVFASSFNPPTLAHVELVRRAADSFSLDQSLALMSRVNADKHLYECGLEDRLSMLELAFDNDSEVSIGISSHAFFVDMIDAIERAYAEPVNLYFIVGFDTFVRVIDSEDRYTQHYYRRFKDRSEALEYLLSKSRLIVAGRGGSSREDILAHMKCETEKLRGRVFGLDLPGDLAERSATQVRERVRMGLPITGLVPAAVEHYIDQHGIYRRKATTT